MAPSETPDPGRFLSQVTACRREDNLFRDLYQDADEDERSVAGLRRRRRRATNDVNSVMKTLSLVEEDGTLYWRDGIPARGIDSNHRITTADAAAWRRQATGHWC